MDDRPIGFFDSGVGGLTIWHETKRVLPHESLVFLADRWCFPYGALPPDRLRERASRIVALLCALDVKLVVVACNTATVHALSHLRARFPHLPFVGVVPVVKTLAERTRTGTIALLSTVATAESAYLADLVRVFAADKQVISVGCDGLADRVEAGEVDGPSVQELLGRYLAPVRASAADVLGLGCTHYSFLHRPIARILGPSVRVYDAAGPVARRVRQVLAERDALAGACRRADHVFTTGDPERFTAVARALLRRPVPAAERVAV